MRLNKILIMLAVTALAAGCAGPSPSPAPSGTSTTSSPSSTSAEPSPSLPDSDGPSTAPFDGPYTPATLRSVLIESVEGIDQVSFWFTGEPKCVVTRVTEPPAGGAAVRGTAFLTVACSPAKGAATLPSPGSSQALDVDERAAVAGLAMNPNTVNVIEAVQTSDGSDELVWTIGLRRSAPWGVGAFDANPVIGIEQ